MGRMQQPQVGLAKRGLGKEMQFGGGLSDSGGDENGFFGFL
jgi:hypothetical protein